MSAEELKIMQQKLQEGLDQAQYQMLLNKALKNQDVVRCNEKGVYEQSARDALAEVIKATPGCTYAITRR